MGDTSKCPHCTEPVYADDQFCAGCGVRTTGQTTALATETRASAAGDGPATFSCPRCGEPVLAGDRFCGHCGAQQPSEAGKRLAQPDRKAAAWSQVEDRLRDATLGEYEILGEVGRGGMAAVYLAHEIALNRRVAIKVMSPGYLLDAAMVERFRREAVTSASLRHPNIVTIHAVRATDQLHFFVMEYVEGQPLDVILRQHGALPVPLVQALLFQVGNAVFYAHGRGVIHRDIKPANIMISGEGEAIVMDFGIAKVAESTATSHTVGPIGTPVYMSPEQCHAQPLDPASDQYSLGIVAYEMLTGRPPFGGSALAIQIAHTTTPPVPIRQVRPEVPAAVADAVERMLAKAPEARWPDVAEAIAACGALPMGARDPRRAEIVRLAGIDARPRGETFRTPVSPRPGATPASDPAHRTVAAVHVRPLEAPLRLGDSVQLQARLAARTGETLPGRVVTWSSAEPAVAAVSADGVITSRAVGETVITARSEGVSGSLAIAVLPPIPVRVTLAPPDGPLEVGARHQLRYEVADRHGNLIDGLPMVWSAAPTGIVSVASDGEVSALADGRAIIRVRCGDVEGSCQLAVTAPAPIVAPLPAPLPAEAPTADPVRIVEPVIAPPARPGPRWSAARAGGALGAATLLAVLAWLVLREPAGDLPAFPDALGAADSAAPAPVAGDSAAGLRPADVATPIPPAPAATPAARLVVGFPAGEILPGDTVALRAELREAGGRTRPVQVQWSSSAPGVLRPVGRGDRAVALTSGTATLTATSPDAPAERMRMTVSGLRVERLDLSGVPDSLVVGGTATAAARAFDQRGRPMAASITWQSSDVARAAVSARGELEGLAPGSAEIRAEAGGRVAVRQLRVVAPRRAVAAPAPAPAPVPPAAPPPPPSRPDGVDPAASRAAARAVGEIQGWFRDRQKDPIERLYRQAPGGPSPRDLSRFVSDVEAADLLGEPTVEAGDPLRALFTLQLVYRDFDRRRETIQLRGSATLGRAGAGWQLQSFSLVGRLP